MKRISLISIADCVRAFTFRLKSAGMCNPSNALAFIVVLFCNCQFISNSSQELIAKLFDEKFLSSKAGIISRQTATYYSMLYGWQDEADSPSQALAELQKREVHFLWAQRLGVEQDPAWTSFIQLQARERRDLSVPHCFIHFTLKNENYPGLSAKLQVQFISNKEIYQIWKSASGKQGIKRVKKELLPAIVGQYNDRPILFSDLRPLYGSSEWSSLVHLPLGGYLSGWTEMKRRYISKLCDNFWQEKLNVRSSQVERLDRGFVAWLWMKVRHHWADKGVYPVDQIKIKTTPFERMRFFEKHQERLVALDWVKVRIKSFKKGYLAKQFLNKIQKSESTNWGKTRLIKGFAAEVGKDAQADNQSSLDKPAIEVLSLSQAKSMSNLAGAKPWLANPTPDEWFVVHILEIQKSSIKPNYEDYQGYANDELTAEMARQQYLVELKLWHRKMQWQVASKLKKPKKSKN